MSGRAQRAGWTLAGALALLTVRPAHAAAHISEEDLPPALLLTLGAPLFVIPSEAGALVTGGRAHFVLGWSGQLPIREGHHLVGGVSLLPAASQHDLQGRLGYRFAPGLVFGGLGVSLDGAGPTWSPELGVNLVPFQDISKSGGIHVLVRGEIAPALNQVRGVSLLLGWTVL